MMVDVSNRNINIQPLITRNTDTQNITGELEYDYMGEWVERKQGDEREKERRENSKPTTAEQETGREGKQGG